VRLKGRGERRASDRFPQSPHHRSEDRRDRLQKIESSRLSLSPPSSPPEIGLGLTAFGFLFTFLGIVFFFDRGLLAMGNVSLLVAAAIARRAPLAARRLAPPLASPLTSHPSTPNSQPPSHSSSSSPA
jgi:hypothetical protein